jgi:zinc resistance-associated protein
MRKTATIALLAAGTALCSYALAQTAGPPAAVSGPGAGQPGMQSLPQAGPRREPFAQLTGADLDALLDARVAAIQAGLKLNGDQQALWPPVERAIRAAAAERRARFERMRSGERPPPPADFMEGLDRRSEQAARRADQMKAFQGALKPLWASLDDGQKRLLPILIRPPGRGGMAFARWRGGEGTGPAMMERMRERMRAGGMGQGGIGPGGPGRGLGQGDGGRRP